MDLIVCSPRTRAAAATLLAALVVFSIAFPRAAAQTDDERARGHFQAGESYFAQRAYADAAREFEAAHRLSNRSLLLLNLATARERFGDFDGAADAIDAYLEAEPESPIAASLRARRDNLRARVEAERAVVSDPDDEMEVQAAPPEGGGESGLGAAGISMAGVGVAEVQAAPSEGGGLSGLGAAGIAMAGVGVAGVAAALVLTLRASSIHSELEGACDASGACPVLGIEDRIDRGRALSRASTATWAVSGALAATGVALLLVDLLRARGDDRGGAGLYVVPGPGMAGLGLSWRF